MPLPSLAAAPLVFEPAAPPLPAPPPGPAAVKPGPPTLAELFRSEESGLLRFALGLVGRRTVAEELVQEAFLRLHRAWGEVENPRAWLYRSLRNLALNHLRDRPREAELDEQSAPDAARLPAEVMGRNEAIGMILLAVAEMPPEDQDLVRLKYHDGLKYRDISRRTGLSVGNVGYRLHHVLKALADSLRRAGIEGSEG